MLFPTTLVGSFPKPDWLIDRQKLAGRFPPRVRAKELSRWTTRPPTTPRSATCSPPGPTWCRSTSPLDDKQIMVGCIDLSDMTIETPEQVAARIRRALPHVAKERVILAPDCGMKYLPREVAVGKLRAMVAAARILRLECRVA